MAKKLRCHSQFAQPPPSFETPLRDRNRNASRRLDGLTFSGPLSPDFLRLSPRRRAARTGGRARAACRAGLVRLQGVVIAVLALEDVTIDRGQHLIQQAVYR